MPGAESFLERACRVATLRSERGYLDTKRDASSVNRPDSLRGEIGHFYDVKKVRNTHGQGQRFSRQGMQ